METFEYLNKLSEPVFVDGTVGLAGHSLALAKQIQSNKRQDTNKNQIPNIKFIGIDKDRNALDIAGKRVFDNGFADNFIFVHDDFKNIKEILEDQNIQQADGILLDLGVSSMQLDEKERGFSYSEPDQPLDMRMDQSNELDAFEVVNRYSETELERVLISGEERYYKLITRNILRERGHKPINLVGDLLDILKESLPKKNVAKFPRTYAADTFRALRLEVNQELSNLEQSLKDCVEMLKPGGKLAVITFHSLEDRIVKNTFRTLENPCTCPKEFPYCICKKKPSVKIITKKPIYPSDLEIDVNRRSKSSKLRVVEKI